MRRRIIYRNPPSVVLPHDIGLGYLAGLIDGEGSILWAKRHTLRVIVTNTDVKMLDWLSIIGGVVYWRRSPGLGSKPVGYWTVGGASARVVLETVVPHLITKRDKALEFLAQAPTVEEGLRRTGHKRKDS